MIKKIDFDFSIPKLQQELSKLSNRISMHSGHNQISLMHTVDDNNPYYSGIGDQTKSKFGLPEEAFNVFNEELKHTYFYTVYEQMSSQFKLVRLRLVGLDQGRCLSWHRDPTKRIHVPIITNEGCKFVSDDGTYHIPADGNAYVIDTTKFHTAINCSNIMRIHLMATIITE